MQNITIVDILIEHDIIKINCQNKSKLFYLKICVVWTLWMPILSLFINDFTLIYQGKIINNYKFSKI